MEDHKFDELTKRLAGPVSRRTALKAAVVTALGGAFGLGKLTETGAQATAPCVPGCSRAIACTGGAVCCTNRTQPCGRCVVCPPGKVANAACNGCACPVGTTPCGAGCFGACPSGQTFNTSTCSCTCGSGQTLCNGSCVETPSCPSGQFLDASCNCQCSGHTACGVSPGDGDEPPGLPICCNPNSFCINGSCRASCSNPRSDTCETNNTCKGTCNCYFTVEGTPNTCFNNAFCRLCTDTGFGSCAGTNTCSNTGFCSCTISADCPPGQICSSGTCGFCSTNADCPAGQTCQTTANYGGGKVCTCTSSSQCDPTQACLSDYCCDGFSYCVATCGNGGPFAKPTTKPAPRVKHNGKA